MNELISNYLKHLTLGTIENILPTDGIYPYYRTFLQFQFPSGLYVMDNQRIYTPIDSGQFGVHHVVSVPKETVPLYAITTYDFSKVFRTDKYVIIFVGCVGTESGNIFLSQVRGFHEFKEHRIIPVAGAKPENEISYIGRMEVVQHVSSSSSEDEDSDEDPNNFADN